jgi:hypothetical protein
MKPRKDAQRRPAATQRRLPTPLGAAGPGADSRRSDAEIEASVELFRCVALATREGDYVTANAHMRRLRRVHKWHIAYLGDRAHYGGGRDDGRSREDRPQ